MLVAGVRTLGGKVETLEVDKPRPLAADEALIDVRSAGVGNWDDIIRTGGWDVGTSPPLALGVEAAGVIKAIGGGPSRFGVDDEVLCHPVPLRDQGTWAPFLIAPVGSLARKPPAISWETAAIFPVPALTAEQVVGEALALHGGETLLVNGAGGITGGLIVQLAALRGVDVLATASPRSAERVRANGAREVIDYRDPMWPQHARALAKDSINAVANAAPRGAAAAMTALADGGRLATITSDPHQRRRQRRPQGCCCCDDRACRRRPAGHHHLRPACIHPRHQRNRGLRPFRRRSTRASHRATRLPPVEHPDPAFLQP
jgi:NADPH:quinone reductase-like Zn-dependent oxidoreductase